MSNLPEDRLDRRTHPPRGRAGVHAGRILAPGLDDNRAYVGTARGQFFAVDRSDGRVVWRYDAWGPVERALRRSRPIW
ncbi:MAG: PQQ-binding-like beta-propeller repeat protein [Deltaproteobacteria bacterium]|nr:PQQ-binding-like beta-propeller repeat protein [Deltaproteobacteria bacterium]